jgi:hypothetical protein
VFSPLFSMCILTQPTPMLIGVWGAPVRVAFERLHSRDKVWDACTQMIFEVIVMIATWWNALSVPREANLPLRTALHRDGVTFFMVRNISVLFCYCR